MINTTPTEQPSVMPITEEDVAAVRCVLPEDAGWQIEKRSAPRGEPYLLARASGGIAWGIGGEGGSWFTMRLDQPGQGDVDGFAVAADAAEAIRAAVSSASEQPEGEHEVPAVAAP